MAAPLALAHTAVTTAGGCLDDTRVLRLLDARLSAAERAEIDAHLDACETCRRLVGAAAVTDGASSLPIRTLERGASVGRYLVLSPIGGGGMGWVYEAYDPELDRRVALKLLRASFGTGDARRLLAREARALGKLSHPNVVQVYDAGEHEGQVFVAMELVTGESLDRWCRGTPKPAWQDVLAAFLDAAQGLSAAHAEGLVHRDVKPSNILRGKDGRARVADFGLATAREHRDDEERPEPSIAAPLAETLPAPPSSTETRTQPGNVVGTPLYMAPEQHDGQHATAASDQYSLCVAIYEGLYGSLPFTLEPGPLEGVNARLLAAKKRGPPAAPPAGSQVQAWVFVALVRGLAPAPEDRYPSINALAAALREDPGAHRRLRRRTAAALAAVAGIAVAAATVLRGSSAFQDPCGHPERQLEGVWDAGVKERVRSAFLSTGRSSAEGTAARVVALLDGYGVEWTKMRGEVCRELRDPQRRELLRLRDTCLERRRGQLQALTTLFAEKPDSEVLDRAVAAAAGLHPIAYCADAEALTARVRPPEDPAVRARVAALQPRVDQLEALYTAGKFKEGLALGHPLLAEARAIPHPPLYAQVESWLGRLEVETGNYETGTTLLRQAATSAAEGNDDVLAAIMWSWLLGTVGARQQRFEEAAVIRALGPSVVARAHDAQSLGAWLNSECALVLFQGRYTEAKGICERAVTVFEKAMGPDHPEVGRALNNLGLVLAAMGDHAGAKVVHARSLALWEKAVGPEHPYTGMSLINLGVALAGMGEYPEALAAYDRALAIFEKSSGHPDMVEALERRAEALTEQGAYPEALASYERALATAEKVLGPDHPDTAQVLADAGFVYLAMGDPQRARTACERALPTLEKALGAEHPRLADVLAVLGLALARLSHLEAALPPLQRAFALWDKGRVNAAPYAAVAHLALGEISLARHRPLEAVPPLERGLAIKGARSRGEIQLTLAEALWQAAMDRPRARALAEEARAAYERLHHGPGLDRATRWLAAHPSP